MRSILRYFNPYGPNEMHEPETHAIPNFVRAAIEKRAIPLYWKGEVVRDFIYVDDLARAHTAVLPLRGLQYFNIGSETGTKMIDVVREIFDVVGYETPIDDLGERPGDVPATYAWSKKLPKPPAGARRSDCVKGWSARSSGLGSSRRLCSAHSSCSRDQRHLTLRLNRTFACPARACAIAIPLTCPARRPEPPASA